MNPPESEPSFPSPGPDGLQEDIPCPECKYDLRGLTEPRCPECGRRFEWSDVPAMRPPPTPKTPRYLWPSLTTGAAFLIIAFLYVLFPQSPVLQVLFWLPLGIGFYVMLAACSGAVLALIQAAIEHIAVVAVLGRPTRRRFRAWWEGVLIGYGLCAVTFMGYGEVVTGGAAGLWVMNASARSWPVLAVTALESILVQYWVVRRRARQWEDPISSQGLLTACVLAKSLVAVPWILFVRHAWIL